MYSIPKIASLSKRLGRLSDFIGVYALRRFLFVFSYDGGLVGILIPMDNRSQKFKVLTCNTQECVTLGFRAYT